MKSFTRLLTAGASCLLILASCGGGAKEELAHNAGIHIIPEPVQLEKTGEGKILLTKNTTIVASNPELEEVASFFAGKLKSSTGYNVQVVTESRNPKQEIMLALVGEDVVPNAEGYTLDASQSEGVRIQASTKSGAFWGMQTLLQLLPAEVESSQTVRSVAWEIPEVSIVDEPRFAYRGKHFDPCRHWIPVEDVKKQLDVMSMMKLNTMHWHLTEDQGWRIEIKKYPELTEVASVRTEGDGTEYGPYFYTQEEVKEIVAYAAERNIQVIPEIEFPGHNVGVLTAFPELGCYGKDYPYEVRNIWGISNEVLCAGNDDVFTFAENVLKEVAELFPSEYLHIGGDECPKDIWKTCSKCQARIKSEGLKDEFELQSYFIHKIEEVVLSLDKKMIGWEEILEGGLALSATVMSWTSEHGGIVSANMGHDVIMTPASAGYYLDHYQGDSNIEPTAICCYSTLDRVYDYDPMPKAIDADKRHHILGVQGNVWSEYLYEPWQMEYMAFPRIIAVAEVGWTPLEKKDFKDFERRLENFQVRMDQHDVYYYIPQPEQPGGSIDHIAFVGESTNVEFTTTNHVDKIIYTIDGSEPTLKNSEIYSTPLTFTDDTTLKIRSATHGGRMSPVRTITIDKAEFAPAVAQTSDEDFAQKYAQGIKVQHTKGRFFTSDELLAHKEFDVTYPTEFAAAKQPFYIKPALEHHMSNVNHFGTIITGYVNVPVDGVYRVSSLLHKVWVDDEVVIDNEDEVKKTATNDTMLALGKGLHKVQFTYIGEIKGGWPSQWNDIRPRFAKIGEQLAFIPDELYFRDVE
ncbi:MAG: family 20 glycosylhydrolase [Porphyromonas sp.]|nr:family 20 glycosylhydrolase [Porphyromonas sp.]